MKRTVSKFLLFALIFGSMTTLASPTAQYFRVWQGFKKPSLSNQEFMNALPQFMEDTVSLYAGHGALNNYIVVIPPAKKPSYIPDELALVGLQSEQKYKEIRETPEGKAYSERHWDVFDKSNSASAKIFVDYSKEKPATLTHNAVYDMFGKAIDWSSGYTLVYIGLRKQHLDPQSFLAKLQGHIELVKETLGPKGLRGYIVTANENYEVAYINWVSREAYDRANQDASSKLVFQDAESIMDHLMFEEAKSYKSGQAVLENGVYSTVPGPQPGHAAAK